MRFLILDLYLLSPNHSLPYRLFFLLFQVYLHCCCIPTEMFYGCIRNFGTSCVVFQCYSFRILLLYHFCNMDTILFRKPYFQLQYFFLIITHLFCFINFFATLPKTFGQISGNNLCLIIDRGHILSRSRFFCCDIYAVFSDRF